MNKKRKKIQNFLLSLYTNSVVIALLFLFQFRQFSTSPFWSLYKIFQQYVNVAATLIRLGELQYFEHSSATLSLVCKIYISSIEFTKSLSHIIIYQQQKVIMNPNTLTVRITERREWLSRERREDQPNTAMRMFTESSFPTLRRYTWRIDIYESACTKQPAPVYDSPHVCLCVSTLKLGTVADKTHSHSRLNHYYFSRPVGRQLFILSLQSVANTNGVSLKYSAAIEE